MKSLPEALRTEEEEEQEEQGSTLAVDGSAPAPGTAETGRLSSRQLPVQAERSHRTPVEYVREPPALVPSNPETTRAVIVFMSESTLHNIDVARMTHSSVSLRECH